MILYIYCLGVYMNKKLIIMPLLLALVSGCGVTDPSNVIDPSNPISENSSENETSDPSTSVPDSSEPGTSVPDDVKHNIGEIREIALGFKNLATNDANVYQSTIKASFRAQLLAYQDYINSGAYTYPNKAIVANETGYILVAINQKDYTNISGYASKQQVYDYEGTITYYNGEPEVTLTKAPSYVKDVTLDYTLDVTDGGSIMDVFNEIKTMPQNKSLTGFIVRPTTLTLRYILKLEDSIGLFTDGVNVVQVHGHSSLTNSFSIDNNYEITFVPGLYRSKTSFTYISHRASSVEVPPVAVENTMTATQLYANGYIKEPKFASDFAKNLVYAETMINLYVFEGYANYYVKNDADYIVFDDVAKNGYTSEETATEANAMFANNDSSRVLSTEKDYLNCIFTDEAFAPKEEKTKIRFVFVPYLMNTKGYFQIHVFENTYNNI